MLGIWKKKPKPQPWYKKLWNDWRQLIVMLSTVLGVLGSGYKYIALDTTRFINTTDIAVVADARNVYASIDVVSEVRENAYIILYLDGQQVTSRVYPKGIKEGKIILDVPIPFTSTSKHIDVDIEIVFLGLRTLFQPQTLEGNYEVERVISSGSTSGRFYERPSEFWI